MLEREKGRELASRSQPLQPHGCHKVTPCGNSGARTPTNLKCHHCHGTHHITWWFVLNLTYPRAVRGQSRIFLQSLSTERFSITATPTQLKWTIRHPQGWKVLPWCCHDSLISSLFSVRSTSTCSCLMRAIEVFLLFPFLLLFQVLMYPPPT